jgi:acetylornithine deacetylase/succinyl-diaminopimelate desuccinylase-like protein
VPLLFFPSCFCVCFLTAAADLRTSIAAFVEGRQAAIVGELVDLLAIPNVAADRENIRRNAAHLRRLLERREFKTELLETAGNPLVYGELRVAGAKRTVLFYAHYDGQPVHPAGWKQASPFTPILREGRFEDGAAERPISQTRYEKDWRIYARSASDDKSPVIALLTAVDALRANGRTPTSNIRVILDGEEEAGSPNLAPAIPRHRDKLAADLMVILDGPRHPGGRPTVVFGARGNLAIELTVYGPKFPLHSGHYGNWVPNPAMRLTQLLASMKGLDGRVLVEGFEDGVGTIPADEQALLDEVPDDPEGLKRLFGISGHERADLSTLQRALQRPSLNIRGLSSGFVGEQARTIIPDRATAAIDIRLVKETPGAAMAEKVRAHIRKQGFHIVDTEPDDQTRARYDRIVRVQARGETEAYRTPASDPQASALVAAIEKTLGTRPVRIRTSGGTVPISHFIKTLGIPAVSVPIVNFDNNQHAENENLRLGHLFDGIVVIAAVLTM